MSDPPVDPLRLWGIDRKRPERGPERPSPPPADLPQPSVMPAAIDVEASTRSATASLLIINRGGGRLTADLVSNAHWVRVSHPFITDNRVRVEVEIDLGSLQPDQPASATLTLRCGGIHLDIPVKACRFTLRRALQQHARNDLNGAKETCRRILQVDPDNTTAALLLASIYLEQRNFPTALKVLQELPEVPRDSQQQDVELPDGVLERILNEMADHPAALRGFEYGIPVYQRMESLVTPKVRPKLDAGLRRGYVEYFRHHLEERRTLKRDDPDPSVEYEALRGEPQQGDGLVQPAASRLRPMPEDELERLADLADRAATRFPDDPLWSRVGDSLRSERRRRGRQQRGQTTMLIAGLVVLAAALVGFMFLLQVLRLRAARAALESGAYEVAVSNATEVLDWTPGHDEARTLRGRANALWAEGLFREGKPQVAAERLEQALRDLPDDPALVDLRYREYLRWADGLLHSGRFDQALDRYVSVQLMRPDDERLKRRIDSLRPVSALYKMLASLSSDEGPVDIAKVGAPDWPTHLKAAGLEPFTGRLQVAVVDLEGDGREEVVMAGTGVRVWRPRAEEAKDGTVRVRFERLFQQTSGMDAWLSAMKLRPMAERPVLEVDWLRAKDSPLGHSLFLWADRQAVHAWTPPDTPYPAQVMDRDGDGRPEIWVRRLVGDVRDPGTAAAVPVPYDWRDGKAVDATLRFSDYYLDELIPDLERSISSPPFRDGEPRRAAFERNARAAVEMARTLARK